MSTESSNINLEELLRFAVQISAGLLHLSSIPILHRDLGLRNILLTNEKVVKIADFGLSKNAYSYRAKRYVAPWQWVDLKFYETGEFTQMSDIWSFGVVLWELWSPARDPYDDWIDKDQEFQRLKNGERLLQPHKCPNEVYQLMRECWNENPNDRPSFLNCNQRLGTQSLMNLIGRAF